MAKMGTGIVTPTKRTGTKSSDHPLSFMTLTTSVNLIVNPVMVNPISTAGTPPLGLGLPIMREGFITDTGLFEPQ